MDAETGDEERGERIRAGIRTVTAGFGTAVVLLWLTFAASRGLMEILVLVLAAALLSWFSTVDVERLADPSGRLRSVPFALAGTELALVLGAAIVLQTGTLFVVAALTLATPVVGLVRVYRSSEHGAR